MAIAPPPITADGLLTTAEVARRIGVCRETVCLAVRTGKLAPALQLRTGFGSRNGAYLFTEQSVIDWRTPGNRLPGL